MQQEEKSIGWIMKVKLKKVGFELIYKESQNYCQWAVFEGDSF